MRPEFIDTVFPAKSEGRDGEFILDDKIPLKEQILDIQRAN